jgi:hypothetical protein
MQSSRSSRVMSSSNRAIPGPVWNVIGRFLARQRGQECPHYLACSTPRMMMPWPGKEQTKG